MLVDVYQHCERLPLVGGLFTRGRLEAKAVLSLIVAAVIDELDLTGASLERCAFHEVTVKKLVLRDARADGLDLRGLSVRQLDCVEGLRGATISQTQLIEIAELFAAHLGVRVAD